MNKNHNNYSNYSQESILNLVEQLKLPFLQISRTAELFETKKDFSLIKQIQTNAEFSLKLIDNYALSLRLSADKNLVSQESFLVSSILYNSAQLLKEYADLYSIRLELDLRSRSLPVVGNRFVLESAMLSLGMSLIEAASSLNSETSSLLLSTHNSRFGVVAGIYSSKLNITSQLLKEGLVLKNKAWQPFQSLLSSSGSGIFIADALLKAINLNLLVSKHRHKVGLGVILKTNQQLELV